jgi:hypothetical protein
MEKNRRRASQTVNAKHSTTIDESVSPTKSQMRHLFIELNREDSQLRGRLLDAAIAGLRLARDPDSADVRRDAARVWAAIEPILSHHLEAEDKHLLPWLDQHTHLSPEILRKVRQCHQKLRTLIGTVARNDLTRVTADQARETAQALTGLAVTLDDAIEDEQRRLLPTLHRALFSATRGTS